MYTAWLGVHPPVQPVIVPRRRHYRTLSRAGCCISSQLFFFCVFEHMTGPLRLQNWPPHTHAVVLANLPFFFFSSSRSVSTCSPRGVCTNSTPQSISSKKIIIMWQQMNYISRPFPPYSLSSPSPLCVTLPFRQIIIQKKVHLFSLFLSPFIPIFYHPGRNRGKVHKDGGVGIPTGRGERAYNEAGCDPHLQGVDEGGDAGVESEAACYCL